jgi:hypothetical protein
MNVIIKMRKQASQFNSLLSSGDGPNVFASDRKVRLGNPGVSCATERKLLLLGGLLSIVQATPIRWEAQDE